MTHSLRHVRKKIAPKVVKAAQAKTKKMLAELPLQELRHARELSQVQMADALDIKQASVSKLERRTDMYISTLRNFIRAMGGELEIRAKFPEGAVRISQFHKIGTEHKIAREAGGRH